MPVKKWLQLLVSFPVAFLLNMTMVLADYSPSQTRDAPQPAQTSSPAPTQAQQPVRPPVVRSPYFVRSGVAYDADEDINGTITVQDPKSFFNPSTKQVTWWGEFKPFMGWTTPQLNAKWYSPSGQLMSSQSFQGMACRLAKATFTMAPYRPEEGRWQVDIYMDGRVIDRRPFVVFDAGRDARDKQRMAAQNQTPEVSTANVATESQGNRV